MNNRPPLDDVLVSQLDKLDGHERKEAKNNGKTVYDALMAPVMCVAGPGERWAVC